METVEVISEMRELPRKEVPTSMYKYYSNSDFITRNAKGNSPSLNKRLSEENLDLKKKKIENNKKIKLIIWASEKIYFFLLLISLKDMII